MDWSRLCSVCRFSFLQSLVGTGMGSVLVLIFVLLAIQGLVYWGHGVAGLAGSILGSHIGAHIAIKRGAKFVKIVLAVVMLSSGIVLLM